MVNLGYTRPPYEEEDNKEREFGMVAEYVVEKHLNVSTNDYIEDVSGNIDTDETDWGYAFFDNDNVSIEYLLGKLKEYVQADLECCVDKERTKELKWLKAQCEGWTEIQNDFYKDIE